MPDYINQNLAAYHWERDAVKKYNLNENNPGIGFERDYGLSRLMVGGYKNSDRKNSLYALLGYTPVEINNLKAGVFGGGVTGYDRPVIPAAGLLFSYQGKDLGANVMLTPNVPRQNIHGFAGLQLRYPIK